MICPKCYATLANGWTKCGICGYKESSAKGLTKGEVVNRLRKGWTPFADEISSLMREGARLLCKD